MESPTSSETPAKRLKLAESLDPFDKLHSDVHELIFQHFGSKDILQTSLVSRSCFAATEASNKCGEKLWLHFEGSMMSKIMQNRSSKSIYLSDDLSSLRKYQNIKITGTKYLCGDVLWLLESRKWTQIEMSDIKFESKKEMLNFFKIIQANVETIKCHRVHVCPNINITDNNVAMLTFPILKELKITTLPLLDCFGPLENFFTGCKNLKKLHYSCGYPRQNSKLEKILGDNSNLEASLQFGPKSLHGSQAFFESITRHQFKLRNLAIRSSVHGDVIDYVMGDVIMKLLKRQAGNLEQLELARFHTMTYEAIETILKMPNLKSLEIESFNLEIRDWDIAQLTSNSSIEKCDFVYWTHNFVDWAKFLSKLIQSMPNLKSLRIPRLNDEIMQYLGPFLTTIKELSVSELTIGHKRFSNVYVKGAAGYDLEILNAVKKKILAKSPEHRTQVQKLIIAENEYDVI